MKPVAPEIGSLYMTREGSIVRIIGERKSLAFPFQGKLVRHQGGVEPESNHDIFVSYRHDGYYMWDSGHGLDLKRKINP